MKCLNCSRFNLRDYPRHVAVGLGRCMAADLHKNGAVFVGIHSEFECNDYVSAKDTIISKRQEWYASRQGR
jgi:hypothetical protein